MAAEKGKRGRRNNKDYIARARANERAGKDQLERLAEKRAAADPKFSSLVVQIDLTQIQALRKAMTEAGVGYQRQDKVIAMALNEGAERLKTQLKRSLQIWTGARQQGSILKRLRVKKAFPGAGSGSNIGRWSGSLQASVEVKSPWMLIGTKNFGAFNIKGVGVGHFAWGRAQVADKAFLVKGIAMHRGRSTDGAWEKGRSAIKPIYGPNLAREVERHAPQVRALQNLALKTGVMPALTRLAELEMAKAKAANGL